MSAPMPSAELRAKILAQAAREKSPTRQSGARRRAIVLALAFGVSIGAALVIAPPAVTGGGSYQQRYAMLVALAWGAVAVLAAALVTRRRSMLGSPVRRVIAAVATPAAMLAIGVTATIVWWSPATLPAGAPLGCFVLTLLFASFPLAAFAWAERGSDPVAPRATGASLGAVCGAFGAILIDLHCPYFTPAHVAVGHVLPVALLAIAGAVLGDRVVAVRAKNG